MKAHGMTTLGDLLARAGEFGPARERLDAAVALYRTTTDRSHTARALAYLGRVARRRGDRDARRCLEEAIELAQRAVGWPHVEAGARLELALLAHAADDSRAAADHLAACAGDGMSIWALSWPPGSGQGAAVELAERLAASQRYRQARRVDGARVTPRASGEASRVARLAAAVGARDSATLASASHDLAEMARELVALADERAARGGRKPRGSTALTPREREVAALLARGLSNRAIGEVLVISEGTTALHVQHILGKLGLASRAQVAVWAARANMSTDGVETI